MAYKDFRCMLFNFKTVLNAEFGNTKTKRQLKLNRGDRGFNKRIFITHYRLCMLSMFKAIIS